MIRSPKTAFGILLILMIVPTTALGWGESNPRAVGMGDAYTALARDREAPDWNPANLGLSDGNRVTVNILSLGIRLRNNSFSLADYNKYSGKTLTDEDKSDILRCIPSEGLRLDLTAEASAPNISFGNWAMTYKAYGASSFTMDRDPFRLALLGNAIAREVSVSDTRGEAYALTDLAFSYGKAIKYWEGGELAAGATLHYLKGLEYDRVVETRGGVVTTDSGFVGSGFLRAVMAEGGSGYSSDLGFAVRFEKDWFFSAAWQSIASKISWNSKPEGGLVTFEMMPVTAELIANGANEDSLVSTDDSTYAIESFSSTLPPAIRLGLARKYRQMTWSIDWEQGLFAGPGQGVTPRIMGGIEYEALYFLPLRAGMAFGGGQGSTYALGFGLHFGPVDFDLGFAASGTPSFPHTKGARLAIGMALHF